MRTLTARRRSRCEKCLGVIQAGQPIIPSDAASGCWEHALPSDCREAYRANQRRHTEEAVKYGWITRGQAQRIYARDDATQNFPDPD